VPPSHHPNRSRQDASPRESDLYLSFGIGECPCAIGLSRIERVEAAAAVAPLPNAPAVVAGVINTHGTVLPVVDLRARFGMPVGAVRVSDRFVIARCGQRRIALLVENVSGLVRCSENDIAATEHLVPGLEHVKGIGRLPDGVIVIHDLDRLLSWDEEQALSGALSESEAHVQPA